MRVLFLFVLPALLWAALPVRWYSDYGQAYTAAKTAHKPLMLFLTQPHCGTCRYMKEEVLSHPDVAAFLGEHFVTATCYMKDDALPERYQSSVTPVFTFVDVQEDEIIEQIRGGRKPARFLQTLRNVVDDLDEEDD